MKISLNSKLELGKLKKLLPQGFSALFKNKSAKQIFFKNSFWMGISTGVNGLLNLTITMFIARKFGPSDYGVFAYALSTVMLFSTLFDFGLTMGVTREFSQDPTQARYFRDIFFLKSFIGLATFLCILVLSFYMVHESSVRNIILLLALYMFFFEALNLFYALFRAKERMEFEPLLRSVQMGGLLVLALIATWHYHSIFYLAWSYVISAAFALIAGVLIVFFFFKEVSLFPLSLRLNKALCKKFLLIGWYLALAKGAGDILTNTDSFLLGYWKMMSGVGLYNAALKVNAATLFPMSLITTAIFPSLISSLKTSQTQFIKYWQTWVRWTMFVAFFLTGFVFFEADKIIQLLYGESYMAATSSLKLLSITALIIYISNLYFHVNLIFDKQRLLFYMIGLGAILNVALNYVLIPRYGIEGSALATGMGQLLNGVLYMCSVSRLGLFKVVDKNILLPFILSFFSAVLMGYFILSIPIGNVIILGCVSVLVYPTIYFILHLIYYKIFTVRI